MFEDLPKLVELGALGAINFVLIFKGIGKMQELTDSVKDLAKLVGDLADLTKETKMHFSLIDTKINSLENRINSMEMHFNSLESLIREHFQNFYRK
mgnify:CR=1 FL=1